MNPKNQMITLESNQSKDGNLEYFFCKYVDSQRIVGYVMLFFYVKYVGWVFTFHFQ